MLPVAVLFPLLAHDKFLDVTTIAIELLHKINCTLAKKRQHVYPIKCMLPHVHTCVSVLDTKENKDTGMKTFLKSASAQELSKAL